VLGGSWNDMNSLIASTLSVLGLIAAAAFILSAWRAVGGGLLLRALGALVLGYSALLAGPALQIYGHVNAWQNLAAIGNAVQQDSAGRPLILFTPDETTRAFVDMYARASVGLIPAPGTAVSIDRLKIRLGEKPDSLVLGQIPGRAEDPALRDLAVRWGLGRLLPPRHDPNEVPAWAADAHLYRMQRYELPNGRRYALFELGAASAR
jgi:hypothetical protein